MSFKRFGGWVIEDKLYAQVKVANELWTFTRTEDGVSECQTSLFFIGWFDRNNGKAKLFTLTIGWICIQVGF